MFRSLDNKSKAMVHPSHNPYESKRVVIKGCGERPIPEAAFVQIAQQLAPIARAVNYGEACSMVPVYKKIVEG